MNAFIQANMANIIVVLIALVVLAILWYKGQRKVVAAIVLSLVTEAENRFGGGAGKLKYAYVTGAIYPRLPFVIRLFLTEDKLNKLIEDAVVQLKSWMSDEASNPRPPSGTDTLVTPSA